MSKPGPVDWATNDTWAAGPDVGDDSKLEPSAAQKADGIYAERRVAPQIWNWIRHRLGLHARTFARSRLKNLQPWDASAFVTATLSATYFAHAYNQRGLAAGAPGNHYLFFVDPAGGALSFVPHSTNNGSFDPWLVGATCNMATGAPNRIDADGSNDRRVIVVAQIAAGGGQLRESVAGAAFGAPGTPPAGANNWGSICCDRDTYGNGYSHWMVGDRPGGGASLISESVTVGGGASVWANSASWAALALAEDIDGIFHTRHPVDALGPSDPGYPVWLVITPTSAVRSADDGATWTVAAHGFVGISNLGPRSVAYSRTSQRFVMPLGDAAGTVAYSDDFGATWTTLAGVIGTTGGTAAEIAGDGYGSFVINERGQNPFWVSVDEGLTWSAIWSPDVSIGAFDIVGEGNDSALNIDDTPADPQCIVAAAYSSGGSMQVYHTLAE